MPSPFPGMDPYLEAPRLWQGFHNRLMTYICDALQSLLPEAYVAVLEVRLYVERGEANGRAEHRVPDVEVLRSASAPTPGGGTAVAAPAAVSEGYWYPAPALEFRDAYVDVRMMDDEERLVTSIELLSPANKRGGQGSEEYRRKQRETLDGGDNLVEIDLLRGGQPIVAVGAKNLGDLPPWDYVACIYHAARSAFQVIPWTLREPLPDIPVPLAEGDRPVTLSVGALVRQAYDNGRFRRLLRYLEPLPVPLRPEDAAWAEDLLRTAGLRGEPDA